MKKILLFVIALISITPVFAGVLTVSNNTALPGSPGQYTTVQAAVNASFAGDTILVHGSSIAYNEGVTVNKKLIIRGPGFYPQSSNASIANGFTITISNNSSNTIIEGFYNMYVYCTNTNPVTNLIIRRNFISPYGIGLNVNINGSIIENNVFYSGGVDLQNAQNVQIRNNIFQTTITSSNSATIQIKNNLFVCAGDAFSGITNAVISNNIFYQKNPMDAAGTNVSTSTFNNNLTYNNAGSQGIIPSGSNIGSGNIVNTDPLFMGVYSCGVSYNINWRLNLISPAKNAGTDGTDIGPTGGVSPIYLYPAPYPITGEPAMPQVQSLTMPVSSVAPGGNLNVTVKARKRN
ncbi:MAG: hypothetical protein A3F72_02205 [Bacteroidetes bacterium RIFCSPLOWO2_12_FULL_35_15]|nr:MAG: hypothetical protein A3F72_02205 [Bacteroidetes bacterium RIFCSPLOWO2_12_FULL_35_15]